MDTISSNIIRCLVVFILLLPVKVLASSAVYDDAPQTVDNKILGLRPMTLNELSAVTGMTDGYKVQVIDGTTMVDCDTSSCPSCGGGIHKLLCCYDEAEVEWEYCTAGKDPEAVPVITPTVEQFAGDGLEKGSDNQSINAVWDTETEDPCGSKSAGYHYLSSAGYPCYCDASNVDKKFSDNTDCAY